MCMAADWILVVAIHLSDRGSFFDRDSYIPILTHEKNKNKEPRTEINRWMVKN